jgi:hypothetical protein
VTDNLTAAEALEIVLEGTTSKKWHEAPAEILAGLRALGFALVPITNDNDPDAPFIERLERASKAVVSHWDEFGAEHGLDESMEELRRALRGQKSATTGGPWSA